MRTICRCLLVALLAALPLPVVLAQDIGRPKRVVLFLSGDPVSGDKLAELQKRRLALWAKYGLVEGRDYVETPVWIGSPYWKQVLPRAREVIAGRPDLILAYSASSVGTLQSVTREVPIVFWDVADPVLSGLVETLRRPGGNITGVSGAQVDSMVKLLEIVKDVRPRARRVAWLTNSAPNDSGEVYVAKIRNRMLTAAAALGLELVEIAPTVLMNLDAVEKALRAARADAFVPYAGEVDLVALQNRTGVPGFGRGAFAVNGGFVALGGAGQNRDPEQAIEIASRILRGENPATIPVRQPSKFQLTVNLKAARALGIEVPASLLIRADEVIR